MGFHSTHDHLANGNATPIGTNQMTILRLLQQQKPAKTLPKKREGGQLKGQVIIADDFGELPDDVDEAFGMKDV